MKYNIGDLVVARHGNGRLFAGEITDVWADDKHPEDDAVVQIEYEGLFGSIKELIHVVSIEAVKPRDKKG